MEFGLSQEHVLFSAYMFYLEGLIPIVWKLHSPQCKWVKHLISSLGWPILASRCFPKHHQVLKYILFCQSPNKFLSSPHTLNLSWSTVLSLCSIRLINKKPLVTSFNPIPHTRFVDSASHTIFSIPTVGSYANSPHLASGNNHRYLVAFPFCRQLHWGSFLRWTHTAVSLPQDFCGTAYRMQT